MLNSIWMNKRLNVLHAYFNDIKVNTHAFNLLILGLWYFKDTKSLFIQFSMCTALLLLIGLFVCLCFVFVFCFLWFFFGGGGACLSVFNFCFINGIIIRQVVIFNCLLNFMGSPNLWKRFCIQGQTFLIYFLTY